MVWWDDSICDILTTKINADTLKWEGEDSIIKTGPSPRAVINLRPSWTYGWEQLEVQVEHSDECPPTGLRLVFAKTGCGMLNFDFWLYQVFTLVQSPATHVEHSSGGLLGKSACLECFTTRVSFQTSSREENGRNVSKPRKMPSQSLCCQALSRLSPSKVSQVGGNKTLDLQGGFNSSRSYYQRGDGSGSGSERGSTKGEVLSLTAAKASSQADVRGGRWSFQFKNGHFPRQGSKTGDKDSPSEVLGRKKTWKSAKVWGWFPCQWSTEPHHPKPYRLTWLFRGYLAPGYIARYLGVI